MTTPDRTIPHDTIDEMVRTIEPDWSVSTSALASGGYLPVYQITVETPTDSRTAILKASPDDEYHGIDVEARMLSILDAHTSIPVPAVYGAVDDHCSLPAPYLLMENVSGRTVERTEMDEIPTATLEAIARASGEYVAQLHQLDAVDAYGYLQATEPTLRGNQPSPSFDQLTVADPKSSWQDRVQAWADDTLRKAEDSRFADLVPDISPVLQEQIDDLSGDFRPAFCHIDNSMENILYDPETTEITAMLDWAFTIAATPAYDLVLIEQSLNGGQWRFVPSAPDNTERIRNALLEGYERTGSRQVLRQLAANRECYQLLSVCRSMNLIGMWPEVKEATPDQVEGAAAAIRETLRSYL